MHQTIRPNLAGFLRYDLMNNFGDLSRGGTAPISTGHVGIGNHHKYQPQEDESHRPKTISGEGNELGDMNASLRQHRIISNHAEKNFQVSDYGYLENNHELEEDEYLKAMVS